MKLFRGIGKIVKPFINIPGWVGWSQISSSGRTIKEAAKDLLETPKATHSETFAQAVQRMHLSEADLQKQMKNYLQVAIACCIIAAGLFLYTLFLLITVHLAAALMSFLVTVMALTLAFRQHFWYFQIKQRKLGCTIREWFHGTFGRSQ